MQLDDSSKMSVLASVWKPTLDVKLTPAEINECESKAKLLEYDLTCILANGPIALINHQTSNEVFDGNCTMSMVIKKDK